MKRILIFFLSTIIFSACEKFEPKIPEKENDEVITTDDLIIYSDRGWHSNLPELFLEKNKLTKLRVVSKSDKEIVSATWKIETKTFQGKEIDFTTSNLGEIAAEVLVKYSNNDLVKKNFKIISVLDIEKEDPVKAFVIKKNGNEAELLFLFSKKRISNITRNNLMFIGTITDWKERIVPLDDYNYVIIEGRAEKVLTGGDYVGVRFPFFIGYFGKIALIHSGNLWSDLSGSVFTKTTENTLASFKLEEKVIPLGQE